MLSTKNLPETKKIPKTIQPGNIVARINNITLEKGFEENSYRVLLHLESEKPDDDFEGFLIDKDDPSKGHYQGQVGRVKLSYFDYGWEIKGEKTDRDLNILGGLKNLAFGIGKLDALNQIEAQTIEQYIKLAVGVLCDKQYYGWCIAGREYIDREGYTKHDLFLPKPVYKNARKGISKNGFPYECIPVQGSDSSESQLMQFNPEKHIVVKKSAEPVPGFVPAAAIAGSNVDFDF